VLIQQNKIKPTILNIMKNRTEITEDTFECFNCGDDRVHKQTTEYEKRDDDGIPYEEIVFWEEVCSHCGYKRWKYEDCPEESNYEDLYKNLQDA
ncbi:hypothetical protein P3598_23845, partial [Vibrio parahaemolyticus]|nr:hypothetical protein [Vibrio parahaemolyticus]